MQQIWVDLRGFWKIFTGGNGGGVLSREEEERELREGNDRWALGGSEREERKERGEGGDRDWAGEHGLAGGSRPEKLGQAWEKWIRLREIQRKCEFLDF